MTESSFDRFVAKLPPDYFRSESEKDIARVAFAAGVTVGAFGVVASNLESTPPSVTAAYSAQDIPMSGELLNDEYALLKHPLAPFDPDKTYRVRTSFKGREVMGEWEDKTT